MNYKSYEGYSKTYILVHNTGTGVMEDPYIEHDVVHEKEAKAHSSALLWVGSSLSKKFSRK